MSMTDIRQSTQYAKYMSSLSWEAKKINSNFYYIKNLLFFKTVKLQRPKSLKKEDILKFSKMYKGLVNFIIEPGNKIQEKNLKKLNFSLTSPFLPSKTRILDLSLSEKNLLSNFSKNARYALRKVDNSNMKIYREDNLESFYKSWKSSVQFGRYILSVSELSKLKQAFGDNAIFLMSENKDSGAIFLVANDIGYYWQAFTSNQARKTNIQYSIVWEGVKWAKSKKCKLFDFEGIYDTRFPIKSWLGFSFFKKNFGGKEVEFPGAYQKWFLNF